jgi:hypothetical protein
MFNEVQGGSVYEVEDNAFGFIYKCWRPPVGFGVNSITGELNETDVIKRDEIPENHFWERFELPKDWKEKSKREKERKKFDKDYFDPYLEDIRVREWNRRLCGVWFWNYNPFKKESELTYITGTHYLYCTYWIFQGKRMDFRVTDMEVFYILKYCETDPDCLGLNFLTRRKLGKTAISGCWAYDRTSKRPTNQHCGIQSKDDDGAEEVMKKAIVQPWKKLPEFFRPVYDLMKGDDPNELRFFNTSRRGSTAETEREEEDALESWIDYGPATEGYYDGPELDTYISDEAGKVEKKIDILVRQDTVRYCSEIEGRMKGKQLYTTTVEADETTGDEHKFQELVNSSNPLKRNENNRTVTGLYTYFLPAHKAYHFDNIYGYPNIETALNFLTNTRRSLEEQGKLRALASAKRKNPMTLQEAFSVDGEHSLYNPILLQEQLDKLSWGDKKTEWGDLVWKDGYEFERPVKDYAGNITHYEINELEWVDNPKGTYEKVKGWKPKDENAIVKNNEYYTPNNNQSYAIGCDPFKYDKTKDKRRSNCAAFAYQIKDELFPNEFDDMFTMRYSKRPESTRLSNYDVLKMAWWCGCKVLFERNVNHWKNDFKDLKCNAFLTYLPGEDEPGILTDGAGKVVQHICNYTESYVNKNIEKVYFRSLIAKETFGWLGFKVDDTQKSDEPMAAGFTLIAVKGKRKRSVMSSESAVEDLMPYRQAV